jgi:monoamine oxidase
MTDIGLFFGGDPMFVLEGGNDRLPKAMAAALGDRIRYGVEVVGLRQSGEDVRLRARVAGAEEVFDAEHVVVALPAPVASRLEIAGGPPAMVGSALAALPQHDILRVQFQVDSAFWRAEPNSGAATTDLFGGRVDRQPYDTVGEPGRPSVLDALIVGEDAGRMAQHSDTELLAEVATQLEKIHPGFGAHRGAHAIQRWVTDPYTLGGWSWPAPGFVSDHLAALQLPYGRLHFAGEHTDLFRATMEGALRSGLRAASQIEQITAAQA